MIPGAGDTHPSVSPAYPCRWKPGVFRQKRSERPYRTSGLRPLHVMVSCRSVTRAGSGQPCPVLPPPTHQRLMIWLKHLYSSDALSRTQAFEWHRRLKAGKVSKTNDEAHIWLNGYVNKQTCRIWSEANPQVYVETPLHPEKLTVWCALWAGGILLQKR
ncbi:hypothetical protein TNCV_2339231 [Trichonephila clavipes]|nr:hypothetical protein TNCV_2339231 [Trichonephila clavipes]